MLATPNWLWLVLALLLVASACFSASETALFSLTPLERRTAGGRVEHLLARPRELLVTVLLGNLVINVLYFAFAARLQGSDSKLQNLATTAGALVVLVVFGEIVPKVLGLRLRHGAAPAMATAMQLLVGILGPVRRALTAALELVHQLISRLTQPERALTPEDLETVLEGGAERGHLLEGEADTIAEIVELGSIRVREIMTPRVDVEFLQLDGSNRERVMARAVAERRTSIPVIDGDPDRVVGRIKVRDLYVYPERSLGRLVMPIKFVPEVASCLDLMQGLREDRTAEAVVVDEWGGTAGFVTIEDLFEEIVGELRAEGEGRVPPAVPLGEGRFRVSGSLSIRDWNDAFGYRVVPTEFETVGGFVTALLGRIPRHGDVVRYGDLVMEVEEVRGRRVLSVEMAVANGGTPSGEGAP